MANDKRERQREARRRAAEEAEARARTARARRMQLIFGGLTVVILVAIGLVALLSSDEAGGDDAGEQTAAEADEAPTTVAGDDGSTTAPVGADGAPACPPDEGVDEPVRAFAAPPPECIDVDTTYLATMSTNRGDLVIELDPSLDPVSVNNFVFLARYGYYDGSTFHRIIEDFVIQGGDPVGDPPGTGGPGYTFTGGLPADPEGDGECLDLTTGEIADEASCVYELGDLAMANRGDPSSNGAQFFVITGPQGRALPPLYSPMGRVVEGLDLALELGSVETGAGDRPVEDIVIESVSVSPA